MEKKRSTLRWAGMFVLAAVLSFSAIGAYGVGLPEAQQPTKRADIVVIDAMKAFGGLEYPKVFFFHDKHTEALKKLKKDCKACHLEEKDGPRKGSLSIKFMRLADDSRQSVMDVYHGNCLKCHEETAKAGEKAGPVECRLCHMASAGVEDIRQPYGFDLSLHARHVASKDIPADMADKDQANCQNCHHEYDKAAKKTAYVKGKEGTCRYCHKASEIDDKALGVKVESVRAAAHEECVACHLKLAPKATADKKIGPTDCAGCHDKAKQDAVKKLKEIPRLKRGQPDAALLTIPRPVDPAAPAAVADDKAPKPMAMAGVPFDHKAHEGYNDTCRVCHHEAMDACSKKCHAPTGSPDPKVGGGVNLERAMHMRESDRSCIGCHAKIQAKKECAACHAAPRPAQFADKAACAKCHAAPVKEVKSGDAAAPAPTMTIDEAKAQATMLLAARKPVVDTIAVDDIPEKVVIKEIADQFEPAEMPHRKIVLALMKNIKDDKLAGYLHGGELTVCQGCHHNSPASKQPPRCGNCHDKPLLAGEAYRPALKAAFHQECMACHRDLGLKKPVETTCNEGCHKEKKK
ncbi:MAG: cytochrome C [Desulfovibrionaceae bacterium]|nr:cytochrome C [Desulfovibrionaceae bacterium]MBF0514496.1 cytochrome C [Desulfovibrionaceae bacterium]